MPIYVYEPTIYSQEEQVNSCCSFEILQSMSEKTLSQCPTCNRPIHRAVTTFQVKEFSALSQRKEFSNERESRGSSSAQNAAALAARHMCGAGCKH